MNTNQERADAPWGSDNAEQAGPVLIGDAAIENPRDFVALENRTTCGAGGRNVYVINRHNDRQITVSVRTRWIYQNEPRSETRAFALEPGFEAYVGCTIPGPTGQRFDRDIVGARFSS